MTEKTGSYIGPWDLHDATISEVKREGSLVYVDLTSYEQRRISLRFSGVTEFEFRGDVVFQ